MPSGLAAAPHCDPAFFPGAGPLMTVTLILARKGGQPIAFTISSTIFLASASSIMVLSM
jgi:hypothetical protein